MIKVLIATRNKDKLKEIKEIAESQFEIFSFLDFPDIGEVIEDGKTLRENAVKKAITGWENTHIITIGDDTGLEVFVLNGMPGIYSSRYSGGNYADNRKKLLYNMAGVQDRRARFVTIAALVLGKNAVKTFEGKVKGIITQKERGKNTFGYDPIFLPDGYTKTFGEMTLEEKNKISHRYQAFKQVFKYLRGVAQPG